MGGKRQEVASTYLNRVHERGADSDGAVGNEPTGSEPEILAEEDVFCRGRRACCGRHLLPPARYSPRRERGELPRGAPAEVFSMVSNRRAVVIVARSVEAQHHVVRIDACAEKFAEESCRGADDGTAIVVESTRQASGADQLLQQPLRSVVRRRHSSQRCEDRRVDWRRLLPQERARVSLSEENLRFPNGEYSGCRRAVERHELGSALATSRHAKSLGMNCG